MSDEVGKRVRKNTGLMLGAKIIGAVLALFGLVFAARGLTTEQFGILIFLHAYILFFTGVATFDSWLIVVRRAAGGLTGEDALRGDPNHFGRIFRFCVSLDLLSASAGFIVAIAIAFLFGRSLEILEGASPYIFFYTFLIFLNQKSASVGVLRLFDRYDLIALNSITIPFVRMVGCGIAWLSDAPFLVYVMVWFAGSVVSYLTLPVLAVIEMRKRNLWSNALDGRISLKAPETKLWRFVLYTNIDTGLAAGATLLPVILAGAVGGPIFAATFRVAQEVATVLAKGTKMVERIIYPEFTSLIAKGEGSRVPVLVLQTGGVMLILGSVIGLIVWLAGPYLLSLAFGAAYADATGLAVLLIMGAAVTAAAGPLFPAFYAAGKPKKVIFARALGLAVMVSSFFLLYHVMGEIGSGFAVLLGAIISLIVVAYIAKNHDWSQTKEQAITPEHQIQQALHSSEEKRKP